MADCDGREDEIGCPVDGAPTGQGRRARQPDAESRAGCSLAPPLLPLLTLLTLRL